MKRLCLYCGKEFEEGGQPKKFCSKLHRGYWNQWRSSGRTIEKTNELLKGVKTGTTARITATGWRETTNNTDQEKKER